MAPVLDRRRARAETVLGREYSELRAGTLKALRSKLAAHGVRFDDADLEAFYNQAWHGLYLRLAQGEQIENHAGFLVNACYCRAIEELRRLHLDRRAEGADIARIATEPDLDAQLDDHTQLIHFMEGMKERLSEREREAATLCYIHGCTRPQTAEMMGVSPKRMEKLMDGVSRKVGTLVADIRGGTWCESRESLMKAYAFGVLDPDGERWQMASAHLEECPGCRRYVRGLRGIASVAPPIGLPLAALAALGAGAAAGSPAAAGGAAGSPGGGAAASAGAGSGGIGAAGAAVAATAVIAVAGAGAFALTRGGDEAAQTPEPPAALAPAAPSTAPPAATQSAPAQGKQPARKRPEQSPATSAPATAATAPAPQTSPAPQAAPAPAAAPSPAERAPTDDGAQEFGFER